jgi:hypothetical protein
MRNFDLDPDDGREFDVDLLENNHGWCELMVSVLDDSAYARSFSGTSKTTGHRNKSGMILTHLVLWVYVAITPTAQPDSCRCFHKTQRIRPRTQSTRAPRPSPGCR